MHELSIAQNILDIVRENISGSDAGRLKTIKLRIGELAGVVPDSLGFCFEAMTKGTDMERARLEIERTGIVAHCEKCGNNFSVEGLAFKCPLCESAGIKVISGNELQVVEIEVEDGQQT